jgi:hypothetical protein
MRIIKTTPFCNILHPPLETALRQDQNPTRMTKTRASETAVETALRQEQNQTSLHYQNESIRNCSGNCTKTSRTEFAQAKEEH